MSCSVISHLSMSLVTSVSAVLQKSAILLVFIELALVVLVADGITFPEHEQPGFLWSLLLSRHPRAIPSGRGQARSSSTCDIVDSVPEDVRSALALDNFYQKYTDAYGIPILSSSQVSDAALQRACYVVRAMLADRKDLRDALYDGHGRVAVIGVTELTTDIPEHSFLTDEWNDRARGLGGTPQIPVTSVSEENLLCFGQRQDRWYEEDLLVHEFAHAIHLIGMNKVNDTFQRRLEEAFDRANDEGLWRQTYAFANVKEYFAEGVQKFFSVDTHRTFIDGVHNNISTRESLRDYDKQLFKLVSEVFPCSNDVIKRCQNQSLTNNHILRMDCQQPGDIMITPSLETLPSWSSVSLQSKDVSTPKPSTSPRINTVLLPEMSPEVFMTTAGNGVQYLRFQIHFLMAVIAVTLIVTYT